MSYPCHRSFSIDEVTNGFDRMTRPHVGAQASIFNKILDTANVDPLDVSYIEMHGIGTQHGDVCTIASISPSNRRAKIM